MVKTGDYSLIGLVDGTGMLLVPPESIISCAADGNYTDVILADGRRIKVSRQLGQFERVLPAHLFIRVHHSYLVQLTAIRRYDNGGTLELVNGQTIRVSRSYRDNLLQRIGKV